MAKRERKLSRQALRILSVALEDPTEPFYGLEISAAAELPTGSIYPILRRLENMGWLLAEWEAIDPTVAQRPPRRLYRLTGQGEMAAREAVETARRELGVPPQPVSRRLGPSGATG